MKLVNLKLNFTASVILNVNIVLRVGRRLSTHRLGSRACDKLLTKAALRACFNRYDILGGAYRQSHTTSLLHRLRDNTNFSGHVPC